MPSLTSRINVHKIPLFVAALGLVAGAASLPAEALVCNIVFDRNDQVIYRDVTPPLDLSDRCLQVVPKADQSSAASVEDIVAGMRPYMGRGGGQRTAGGVAAGGTGSTVRTAAPAAASTS